MNRAKGLVPRTIRCAVYTRKSSEEGLEQEFNSLDAQRESAENYVASMKHEGWVCLPDRYDDGGFSGGNMERPGVQRLMADIKAGKIDCVVVYKVDRLSRSLLDFARMMENFEKHRVSFVSVTQQFNTSHSMGRLTLNILLSFAQFEREIISERTRDKIAAARRKGKWCGGRPVLGYDVDPASLKLVVNPGEAERVRAVFELYLRRQSLISAAEELRARGWSNKAWTSRKGRALGGAPFDKTSLQKLLTNPVYIGKVKHHSDLHRGEHEAMIDVDLWNRVQMTLRRNGRTGGMHTRNKHGALLKGLLRCGACRCAMTHTYTVKRNGRAHRYYRCGGAVKRGAAACPFGSIPAQQIEDFVAQRVRASADDPALRAMVLQRLRGGEDGQIAEMEERVLALTRDARDLGREIARVAADAGTGNGYATARLADLNERAGEVADEKHRLEATLVEMHAAQPSMEEVAEELGSLDELFGSLCPGEQARLLRLLVREVVYDGARGKVAVTFRAAGMAGAPGQETKEVAA